MLWASVIQSPRHFFLSYKAGGLRQRSRASWVFSDGWRGGEREKERRGAGDCRGGPEERPPPEHLGLLHLPSPLKPQPSGGRDPPMSVSLHPQPARTPIGRLPLGPLAPLQLRKRAPISPIPGDKESLPSGAFREERSEAGHGLGKQRAALATAAEEALRACGAARRASGLAPSSARGAPQPAWDTGSCGLGLWIAASPRVEQRPPCGKGCTDRWLLRRDGERAAIPQAPPWQRLFKKPAHILRRSPCSQWEAQRASYPGFRPLQTADLWVDRLKCQGKTRKEALQP